MVDELPRKPSRRQFLALSGAVAGVGLLQACASPAQPTPAATQAAQVTATTKPATQAPAATTAAATTKPATAAAQATATTKPADAIKRGGTYTMARNASLKDFNPFSTGMPYPIQRTMFNTLARYDSKVQIQPELAEKWTFSNDGKALTLKLREGVKFHSGREFTSADVKASVAYSQDPEFCGQNQSFLPVKQVETPDKYTAVLKFDALYPGVFDMLDMLWMVDKETFDDPSQMAVGTGPFKFDKYVPKDRAEMVAFKDYWEKGQPYLDRFIVREIPDVASLAINLESGAVDCIWMASYVDIARLKDSAGKFLTDMGAPGAQIFDVGLNCQIEPLNNKKVRQAIAWSIDRARFCRTSLQGLVEPTCLMWPSHSWAYFKDIEGKIGFDLDKAKALLKEAGVDGFDTEIVGNTANFGHGELAQIMQADLKKIGVNAKVTMAENAQYNSRANAKRDAPILVHQYSRCNRDPGSLVVGAISFYTKKQGTWTHFESAEYDKLRDELQSTLDQEKRKATCRTIQELVLDECFTISVAPQQRAWAYASYVKGFAYDLTNAPLVGQMWLDK